MFPPRASEEVMLSVNVDDYQPSQRVVPWSASISHPPSTQQATGNDADVPLRVQLKGWRRPQVNYKTWVDSMSAKHRPIWERAGIYDSIISSKCAIKKLDDVVLGLAANWCCETNSFVFDWGECTITVEDMYVLGGFSLLGDSVSTPPLENSHQAMESLMSVRRELARSPAKKVSQQLWLKAFMNRNHEFEHEGFLAYWLSMFVFPHAFDTIGKHMLPIAVHLAAGRRISLAPALLANIYRDLGLIANKKLATGDTQSSSLTVWAPFQLVQVWIWERFPHLRPKLYMRRPAEPRMARWVVSKKSEVEDVKVGMIDWNSAGDKFQWRPYASNDNGNILFSNFYGNGIVSDNELQSYAKCLRACELTGIDCVEQYRPQRVAMQFGCVQDVPPPPDASKSNNTDRIACWEHYSKNIDVTDLHIPSPDVIPRVTARYLEWRKQFTSHASKDKFARQAVEAKDGTVSSTSKSKKSAREREVEDDEDGAQILGHGKEDTDNAPDVPPGFEPRNTQVNDTDASQISILKKKDSQCRKLTDVEDNKLSLAQVQNSPKRLQHQRIKEAAGNSLSDYSLGLGLRSIEEVTRGVPLAPPPGFPPKCTSTQWDDVFPFIPPPPGFPPKYTSNQSDDVFDKDPLPNQELLFSNRKHQRKTANSDSTVISGTRLNRLSSPSDASFKVLEKGSKLGVESGLFMDEDQEGYGRPPSIILGAQLEDSSTLPRATDFQVSERPELEGEEPHILITVDSHVSLNSNKNEAGMNEQASKESKMAADIRFPEENEKPWTKVERKIEQLERDVKMLKDARRARGYNIP